MLTEYSSAAGKNKLDETLSLRINRVIALWGFSEAALGGILHALKIPFTGMFLGGAAVIFISLIAHYSKDKSEILRATLIVVLVKAFVSPHSPLTAYFAVGLQGVLGFLFFRTIKYERIASLLLGFFSLLFSALQKLILLTILFGTGLWNSIDLFADFVLGQLPLLKHSSSFSFSFLIILFYSGIHVAVGIYVGLKAASIPNWILTKLKSSEQLKLDFWKTEENFFEKKNHKKKLWWSRRSGILLFVFFLYCLYYHISFPSLAKTALTIFYI